MIIPINEQYRITTDPYQWIVQKKRSRKGKEDWESQTYHPSIQSALQSFGEFMVRQSDATTLTDALAEVESITTTLSQALTPQFQSISDVKKTGSDG